MVPTGWWRAFWTWAALGLRTMKIMPLMLRILRMLLRATVMHLRLLRAMMEVPVG
jgi:hypothetical protein